VAKQEHLAVLMQGVQAWNGWRKKNPTILPDLKGAYLWGVDLRLANLCRANLEDADLNEANLSGANFVEANLKNVSLSHSNLTKAELFVANLRDADLTSTNFSEASFFGTDLSGADLQETKLWGAEIFESNFTNANLSNADLWLCRMIRCDLTHATVENAIVKDLYIHELKGRPKIPNQLRLDREGIRKLQGEETHSIFHQPAILEVYFDAKLRDLELACYQMHLANLHLNRLAANVFLCGQRFEGSNTILSFHASTYDDIYQALPILLAPFPLCQSIDWNGTFAAIPAEERSFAMTTLINQENNTGPFPFAERLTRVFLNFRSIRITRLKHVGNGSLIQLQPKIDAEKDSRIKRQNYPEPSPQHFLIVPKGEKYEILIADKPMKKTIQ
jgi:hypothetical protein